MPARIYQAKYFLSREFDCKCGCGLNNIDPKLISMLDEARGIIGIPLVISSGCRCKQNNKDAGGSITSSHLTGLAVDIKCYNSQTRYKLIMALSDAGFNRFGISKTFIHTDIDKLKPACLIYLY